MTNENVLEIREDRRGSHRRWEEGRVKEKKQHRLERYPHETTPARETAQELSRREHDRGTAKRMRRLRVRRQCQKRLKKGVRAVSSGRPWER